MTRDPAPSFLAKSARVDQETTSIPMCRVHMHTTRNTIVWGLGLSLLLVAGCDAVKINHGKGKVLDDRAEALAEAYCAVYASCDCAPIASDALFPDPSQCVAEEKQRLLSEFEQAEDDDLSFDQGCMDQLLSRYAELDCASISTIHAQLGNPATTENFGCAMYHGDETNGICELATGTPWSDCATGLQCFDHSCQPALTLADAGEPCTFNSSALALDCQPGLYCDQFDGCQPGQELGEACMIAGDGSMRCAAELFCAPTGDSVEGICQALLDGGEACVNNQQSCHGWCQNVPDSPDPNIGECLDVPAVCQYESLQAGRSSL